MSDLARFVDERAPRPEATRWTTSSIGHLLENRVYLGEVTYRSRRDARQTLPNPGRVTPRG